jgi:hypothetical protein
MLAGFGTDRAVIEAGGREIIEHHLMDGAAERCQALRDLRIMDPENWTTG